ncbi:restriction endonuclease subunit S [Clostridium tetani]|uniref:restriction endonuclease subunit S n=1 Tax=Clostridium tetani TaxID=1513 RepID=UPI00100A93C6|nr:restriction endonuclease subunit S [Clostridium tetani]RXI51510.1 hypothetical protein DP122_11060 [Clostridium tetani]RXI56163.1 hypothetical protein DP124_00530 [Clostridium tetani]RXM71662.1 hypothetical protein DP139_03385 [Clostridium tetani]BDR85082.1 restriction modification system DNA specificity domain-containing protein [Clostridium tetani]
MFKHKKYERYKYSGVEWIGKIPEQWSAFKLKQYCEVKDGTHDTPKYVEEVEENYPLITSKDIINNNIDFSNAKYISKEDYIAINKRSDVTLNDVIMPMIGTIGNPAIVSTNRKFSIKNVALFKTNENKIKAKFLQYLIESYTIQEQFNLLNRGGVQNFVSLSILKNMYVINPKQDINEIVEYLDKKTSEIDSLVADKEKLVTLLEEKRQAIIVETVTKGLNPNVKMKDSGVEWIGEIPQHWNIILFKRLIKGIKDGTHGTHDRVNDGEVLLSAKNIQDGNIIISESESKISYEKYSKIVSNGYPSKGDILLCCVGTIGRSCVYSYEKPLAFQRSVAFIRLQKNEDEYFYNYFIQTKIYQEQLMSYAKTSAQSGVYMNDIINTYVLKVPLNEQVQIVEYLNTKVKEINSLVLGVQKQIEKLKEYRQSLISEVVTGKIDVRDYFKEA